MDSFALFQERGGLIRRIYDTDKHVSLELFSGGNILSTFLTAPCSPFQTLGIKLPHAVLILKNINRSLTFSLQV